MIGAIIDILKKTLFWLLTSIVSLFLILFLILQISPVQNYLKDKIVGTINTKTGQEIQLDNINIKWFDQITLSGLQVMDYKENILLKAKEVDIDYHISNLLVNNHLYLDGVIISDGVFNLVNYKDTLNVNLIEFINAMKSLKETENKPDSLKRPLKVTVKQIDLHGFNTYIRNEKIASTKSSDKIDFSDFGINISEASFYDFRVKKDTIEAVIGYLIGNESQTGFKIQELHTDFLITNKLLSLENFHFKTPNSVIEDSFSFRYNSFLDLNHFNERVNFTLKLTGSRIDMYDLSYILNVPRRHELFYADAKISGEMSRLNVDDLVLGYNHSTKIRGSVEFFGLPQINEAFIDARITSGYLHPDDFSIYLGEFSENVKALGQIEFNGRFLGFLNDFVANATFNTEKGKVTSDINLKFPGEFADAKYSGGLVLESFNAGAFIQNKKLLQKVNLEGNIDGQGFRIDNASFLLDAEITDTGINGYSYDFIKANGRFAASYFQGSLYVDDPHCKINGVGTLNLGIFPEQIEVRAFVDQLDFKDLGLSDEDISLKTSVYANVTGLNIDSLIGKIYLDSTTLAWEDKEITLDTIAVESERNEGIRSIYIELAEANMELTGDFYFSQLTKDIGLLASEIKSYFDPDFDQRMVKARDTSNLSRYTVDFAFNYQNINPYLDFLVDDLLVSEGGIVEGTYYQRENATLFLYGEVDSLQYKGIKYYENILEANASKDVDSLGIIANIYLHSERQEWKKIPETRDLSLEAVWFNNKVTLQTNIKQPENKNSAQINSELKIQRDKLVFTFMPSNMVAFGERWFFNPYNRIEIRENEIFTDNLEVYNGEQAIRLEGIFSDKAETDLKLDFKDFELKSISSITPFSLSGNLTSTIELKRNAQDSTYRLLSEVKLRTLVFDDLLIGNVYGSSDWVDGLDGLSLDLVVERESVRTINVEGFYYPYKEDNQLEVGIAFDQANIKMVEPLFTQMFSNIGGEASGSIRITGSLEYPLLNGKSTVNNGRFTFDYLNTNYVFDGDITFDNEEIGFQGIDIRDRNGDHASISGHVRHKGFKDFKLNLGIDATRFLFLNTTDQDNNLYYGSAKGTGNISVTGPANDLLIEAKMKTESGTKIYIPIEDGEDFDQKEYISFVNLRDSTNQVDLKEIVRNTISGVRLDFDLDITNDAYMELIFDIKTGDIIRGRGNGNINMTLDTQGDFQLFGDINIVEGGYNFTIPNFINKEFSIQPGSTITWYGDPYAGILNLKAIYRQMASLADYDVQQEGAQGVHQRYPFLVILDLQGDMLSPKIDFEIKIDETQVQPEATDQARISLINNDEQELKRQVFSLLILRKFSPRNGFSIGGGAVGSSLSEFLSNQFSYFISQVDENLEVDIDLSTYKDTDAFNTFQLRLAYTFFDGRLRVSGGGLVSQSGGNSDPGDGFIGDWSVRYLLTKDGHLRIKAFSQAKRRIASANSTSANLFRETGVSFQYIKSFNEFSELLRKSREESIEETSEESAESKPTSSIK